MLATLDDATAESLEGYGARGFPAEESGRPWDNDEFDDPADIRELDHIDAGQLLAELWDGQVPSEEEDDDDDEWRAMRAPFVRLFRGRHPHKTGNLLQSSFSRRWERCRQHGSG